MKLRSLALRNFRRHAASEIEFPDGVTAVVGPNGAGKSSLLEGISFALFGTDALATPKALLRSTDAAPADAVSAALQFEVGGQRVEVLRELRGRAQTPNAQLTIDGNVVVPSGAGSSEAATRKVEEMLGMDREAFHTTVVARQGELSRLSDASPADRKRLVLRMLGIDRLDDAIEKARARRRDVESRLAALRAILPEESVLAAAQAQARATQAQADQAATLAAATLANARSTLLAAEANLQKARDAAAAAAQARSAVASAQAIATAAHERVERAARQLASANAAAAEAARLAPLAAPREALTLQWQAAQDALSRSRTRALAERRIAALQERHEANSRRLAALAPMPPVDVAAATQRLDEAMRAAHAAQGAAQGAERELAVLRERADRLQRLGGDAPCPTCERPLAGHADRLHEAARQELSALAQKCHALDAEAAVRAKAQAEAAAALAAARDAQTQAQRVQNEREALLRALADDARDLESARRELPPAAPVPDAMDALRAHRDAAQQAHDALQRASAVAGQQPSAAKEHAEALAAYEATQRTLREAQAAASAVAFDDTVLRTASLAVDSARVVEADAARTVARTSDDVARARAEVAAAMARFEEVGRLRAAAADVATDVAQWTALASPRNDGLLDRFRDHVVDRIGPAIQKEASRLLAAFTGGRYTELMLDADYEVFVVDGATAYALERYSGGEQDLVHLALRLAVSRMLAQRSGLEVRLLALDEVFGALDQNRRSSVVEALHGLSTLYQQVLVVSHMESLQEALDQAIVVVPDGPVSHLAVHNG